jgi:hypothetical protein
MSDVVEPDVDILHGKVVNEDTEMPVGGGEMTDAPDEGDTDSDPANYSGPMEVGE